MDPGHQNSILRVFVFSPWAGPRWLLKQSLWLEGSVPTASTFLLAKGHSSLACYVGASLEGSVPTAKEFLSCSGFLLVCTPAQWIKKCFHSPHFSCSLFAMLASCMHMCDHSYFFSQASVSLIGSPSACPPRQWLSPHHHRPPWRPMNQRFYTGGCTIIMGAHRCLWNSQRETCCAAQASSNSKTNYACDARSFVTGFTYISNRMAFVTWSWFSTAGWTQLFLCQLISYMMTAGGYGKPPTKRSSWKFPAQRTCFGSRRRIGSWSTIQRKMSKIRAALDCLDEQERLPVMKCVSDAVKDSVGVSQASCQSSIWHWVSSRGFSWYLVNCHNMRVREAFLYSWIFSSTFLFPFKPSGRGGPFEL